ncbi:MAG: glycosyltransferase family 2 protein [Anaerolineae bacterium]|nr:glycosyltransferase family 2 protein [Anaerolineae bacterium]
MNPSPKLAVVIVSWNVRGLLTACLRSLLADLASTELETEVWVVDNASSDGTPQMVEEAFPDVHLIASDENLGFVRGNNRALNEILDREAPPVDYFWLLNPDTEVQPGATAALVAALEAHPKAGIVGPKLLYPDGSLQHSAFRFPGLVQLLFELFPMPARLYDTSLNGRYPRRLYEGAQPFLIDHPLGASMLVRGEAVADVGLMDEDFFMYCEEIDWCWRMRETGWRALCAPAAHVIHHAGQSSGQVQATSFANLWKSRAILYTRHRVPIKRHLAQLLVRIGMKRRLHNASPEMTDICRETADACKQILQAWEETG